MPATAAGLPAIDGAIDRTIVPALDPAPQERDLRAVGAAPADAGRSASTVATGPAQAASDATHTSLPRRRPELRAILAPVPAGARGSGRRRAAPAADPVGERRGSTRLVALPSALERPAGPAAPDRSPERLRSMAAHPSLHRRPALAPRPTLHRIVAAPEPAAVPQPAAVPRPIAEWDQDPAELCANLALCVVEIVAGARPLDQLARWVTDDVYVQLLRRTVIASRARAVAGEEPLRPRVTIGVPRVTHPSKDAVEAVVLVHQTARTRAVTVRLERHRSRWRASALTML